MTALCVLNDSAGRIFVNMSATCFFVITCSMVIMPAATAFLSLWYLKAMCFALVWNTGCLDSFIAGLLSTYDVDEISGWPKCSNKFWIHYISMTVSLAVMYSASVDGTGITPLSFFDDHVTGAPASRVTYPPVECGRSWIAPWDASHYTVNANWDPERYLRHILLVVYRYRRTRRADSKWIARGSRRNLESNETGYDMSGRPVFAQKRSWPTMLW